MSAGQYHYYRFVAFTTLAAVTGYFRHDDFQILPLDDPPPLPKYFAPRPFLIEVRVPLQAAQPLPYPARGGTVDELDAETSTRLVAQLRARQLVRLLSVLTYYHLLDYSNLNGVWIKEDMSRRALVDPGSWCSVGYSDECCRRPIDAFTQPDCPPLPIEEPEDYYSRVRYAMPIEEFRISASLPTAIDRLNNLSERAASAFNQACTLYCGALLGWSTCRSLAVAGLISAIETLSHFDSVRARPKVGRYSRRPNFGVRARFKKFLENHGITHPEDREQMDLLYKLRCKILHEGQLLIGDADETIFADLLGYSQQWDTMYLAEVTRGCLYTWLLRSDRHLKLPPTTETRFKAI